MDAKEYVRQLYIDELGRKPDQISQAEIDAWAGAMTTAGLTAEQVRDQIERSPEGVNYDANRIYQSQLGRGAGEDAEPWRQALLSGNLTDEQMEQLVSRSDEGVNYDANRIFATRLGRDASTPDAEPWKAALREGAISEGEMDARVLQSSEFADKAVQEYGPQIQAIYKGTFDREGSPEEIRNWAVGLKAGTVQQSQLPTLFLQSTEGQLRSTYKDPNAGVGRPITDTEYQQWLDAFNKGEITMDQFKQAVQTSPEYLNKAFQQQFAQEEARRQRDAELRSKVEARYQDNMEALRILGKPSPGGFQPTTMPAPTATPSPFPTMGLPQAQPATTAQPQIPSNMQGVSPFDVKSFYQAPTYTPPAATTPSPFAAIPAVTPESFSTPITPFTPYTGFSSVTDVSPFSTGAFATPGTGPAGVGGTTTPAPAVGGTTTPTTTPFALTPATTQQ